MSNLIGEQQARINEAAVSGIYDNLAAGNGEAVLAAFSPGIKWTVTAGLPYGGTYIGRDAVADNVFARFTAEWEDFAVVPERLFAVHDAVLALGHYVGKRLETGKSVRARFVHVWKLENHIPVEFETIADTHTMLSPM